MVTAKNDNMLEELTTNLYIEIPDVGGWMRNMQEPQKAKAIVPFQQ